MVARGVIVRQHVSAAKATRARKLRREMTEEEQLLWAELHTNRLQGLHFRRQQIIDGFIVNFYCHRAGLVVEVDGSAHAGRTEYDAERDRILAARRLHVLRVTNEDVRGDLPAVLTRITKHAVDRLELSDPAWEEE